MPLTKLVTMREALSRPDLLGNALPGESWFPHRTALIALMGEPLQTIDEVTTFAQITGNRAPPTSQVREATMIAGRRSGKTRCASVLVAYVSCLTKHTAFLAPGERAVVAILAGSTVQANVSFQGALGVLEESPALSKQIEKATTESIRLKNRCDVEVRPANFRTIRGITSPLICCDETSTSYNEDNNANSDTEIFNAARPTLGTTGGMLFSYSSPWAKRGTLFQSHQGHFAKDSPNHLVFKGPTELWNPLLDPSIIAEAFATDPQRAASEYGADFADGVAAILTTEAVNRAVDFGVVERVPVDEFFGKYRGFVDMAGGSGQDSATLAIAHLEGDVSIVDIAFEIKPPFSPSDAVAKFAEILKRYKLADVTGDRWSGGFAPEAFRKNGIEYRHSARTSSEIFGDVIPLFNSDRIAIPESQVAISQFTHLQRYTTRGGKGTISHPPGGHDDLAVAISGAATLVAINKQQFYMLAAPEFIGAYSY
ncbi:hypothetical protein QBK99_13285 [Corticibacterium sp. UT-5YL-CI-8]|nr:hypothetical protein [Tianweitania sp. UT-5YL-CI-8]